MTRCLACDIQITGRAPDDPKIVTESGVVCRVCAPIFVSVGPSVQRGREMRARVRDRTSERGAGR